MGSQKRHVVIIELKIIFTIRCALTMFIHLYCDYFENVMCCNYSLYYNVLLTFTCNNISLKGEVIETDEPEV